MKKSIVTILSLCLTAVALLALLSGCSWGRYGYENADAYSVGGGSVSAESVSALDIDWISGSVVVEQGGVSSEIVFAEQTGGTFGEDYRLRYLLDGNTLKIKFMKSGLSSSVNYAKPLTVTVPEGLSLQKVAVKNISGKIRLDGITAITVTAESVSNDVFLRFLTGREMTASSVSGKVIAKACKADILRAESVSGEVDCAYCTDLAKIDIKSVSGALYFTMEKPVVGKITAETVSGDIEFRVAEGLGFFAEFDRKENAVRNEVGAEAREDGYCLAGEGDCRISAKSVSGILKLLKLT